MVRFYYTLLEGWSTISHVVSPHYIFEPFPIREHSCHLGLHFLHLPAEIFKIFLLRFDRRIIMILLIRVGRKRKISMLRVERKRRIFTLNFEERKDNLRLTLRCCHPSSNSLSVSLQHLASEPPQVLFGHHAWQSMLLEALRRDLIRDHLHPPIQVRASLYHKSPVSLRVGKMACQTPQRLETPPPAVIY